MKRSTSSAASLLSCAALLLSACANNDARSQANDPQRASQINVELATDYLRKGNLAQAKEKIDRSVEQDPRNARAWGVGAMLYEALGERKKADAWFERAVALDPKDPEIRNNYAVHLCRYGRFERGEKQALEAAGNPLHKTREVAYLNAGNCARSAGDLTRAEEHYRRALKLQPRFAEALLQLAEMQYARTEYISARAFLQRYMEVGRTTPATLWLGHRIELSLGNVAEAQHYGRRLKNEYPSAPQTRELLESERNPG
ncbi:MAG TPA: type IV pilus biogenesis/stability protein PilW [Steroidobacter sp.]|jgi:type IV pilus assembly protein PilF|nr:type IV pilus biogenesis/stability protein PilW [Steroidobacteraceae bacterium]HLS80598.1 type IV pilus biogenesis/stability protein PilW [Steroidobacter sp.]